MPELEVKYNADEILSDLKKFMEEEKARRQASVVAVSGKEEVFLHSNDIPFEILTTGKEDGSRSVIPLVPFVVFVEDSNYSVELDFMEGIGVVEIAISQNGSVIYSSSENILSPLRKYLQLPFGVSGEYCIEIKGDNGAYAYGCFEL